MSCVPSSRMTTSSYPAGPKSVPAVRRRILLVDDDEPAARLLAHMLGTDYQVTISTNGLDGLALARSAPPPELIITDVEMPYLDGFSMVRELRASPHAAHVPVIFLTAHARPAEVVEGIQAGARHYVTKPVNVDDLVEKVRHCLRGAPPSLRPSSFPMK